MQGFKDSVRDLLKTMSGKGDNRTPTYKDNPIQHADGEEGVELSDTPANFPNPESYSRTAALDDDEIYDGFGDDLVAKPVAFDEYGIELSTLPARDSDTTTASELKLERETSSAAATEEQLSSHIESIANPAAARHDEDAQDHDTMTEAKLEQHLRNLRRNITLADLEEGELEEYTMESESNNKPLSDYAPISFSAFPTVKNVGELRERFFIEESQEITLEDIQRLETVLDTIADQAHMRPFDIVHFSESTLANDMPVMIRPINPEVPKLLQEGAVGKGFATKEKSAPKESGPLSGYIPVTAAFSKVGRDERLFPKIYGIDIANLETDDPEELQEQIREKVSEQQIENDHLEMDNPKKLQEQIKGKILEKIREKGQAIKNIKDFQKKSDNHTRNDENFAKEAEVFLTGLKAEDTVSKTILEDGTAIYKYGKDKEFVVPPIMATGLAKYSFSKEDGRPILGADGETLVCSKDSDGNFLICDKDEAGNYKVGEEVFNPDGLEVTNINAHEVEGGLTPEIAVSELKGVLKHRVHTESPVTTNDGIQLYARTHPNGMPVLDSEGNLKIYTKTGNDNEFTDVKTGDTYNHSSNLGDGIHALQVMSYVDFDISAETVIGADGQKQLNVTFAGDRSIKVTADYDQFTYATRERDDDATNITNDQTATYGKGSNQAYAVTLGLQEDNGKTIAHHQEHGNPYGEPIKGLHPTFKAGTKLDRSQFANEGEFLKAVQKQNLVATILRNPEITEETFGETLADYIALPEDEFEVAAEMKKMQQDGYAINVNPIWVTDKRYNNKLWAEVLDPSVKELTPTDMSPPLEVKDVEVLLEEEQPGKKATMTESSVGEKTLPKSPEVKETRSNATKTAPSDLSATTQTSPQSENTSYQDKENTQNLSGLSDKALQELNDAAQTLKESRETLQNTGKEPFQENQSTSLNSLENARSEQLSVPSH